MCRQIVFFAHTLIEPPSSLATEAENTASCEAVFFNIGIY